MNTSKWSWDALLAASIVFVAGALTQMQPSARAEDATQPEGRIVELNSGATTELPKSDEDQAAEEPAKPVYWIGVHGRVLDNALLRTQFQLAEDMGVVIEDVVKESPAEKAGLRKHDIILRAEGEPVQGMEDLAELVSTGAGKPIELRIIRLAQEETVVVTPEVRPEGLAQSAPGRSGFGAINDPEAMRQMMEGMQNIPGMAEFGGMRMFGPGVIINGQRLDLNSLPNGVAVTIERSGDGPAKITIKQGDKTWNIEGDDATALEQLPEDVRNYVAQLMQGPGQFGQFNFNLQKELEHMIPHQLGQMFNMPAPPPPPDARAQQDPVLERMEQLERQLQELEQRLDDGEDAQ